MFIQKEIIIENQSITDWYPGRIIVNFEENIVDTLFVGTLNGAKHFKSIKTILNPSTLQGDFVENILNVAIEKDPAFENGQIIKN
jgi:hypothetical protein